MKSIKPIKFTSELTDSMKKIFLAVFELSILTNFIRQCHLFSIFWSKKQTHVAPLEKKSRKIYPKYSVEAKLKFGKLVSKQNCLKIEVYIWLEKRIDFMIFSVLENFVNLKKTGIRLDLSLS